MGLGILLALGFIVLILGGILIFMGILTSALVISLFVLIAIAEIASAIYFFFKLKKEPPKSTNYSLTQIKETEHKKQN